jgi:hypothetical protein
LFVQSHKDKEVADRDTVGHRGTPIGTLEGFVGGKQPRIRFRTRRALQCHDGLQIDLPTQGTPFGFALEKLWIVSAKKHEAYQAPAGSLVEVPLPDDYPTLPLGVPIYCSSSQEVKQRYRFERPKPGLYRTRRPLSLRITLAPEMLTVKAQVRVPGAKGAVQAEHTLAGPFAVAQDTNAMEQTVEATFSRLGATPFILDQLIFDNPEKRFVPVSRLNQLRRDVIRDMEKVLAAEKTERVAGIVAQAKSRPPGGRLGGLRWSIKVDRMEFLDAFTDEDWAGIDEVIIDIARDHPALLREKLEVLSQRVGREHIRLALPPLTRKWEEKGVVHKIQQLRAAGWQRWEAGNLSAWSYLGLDPRQPLPTDMDLATDWSVYVINRLAALQLEAMGVRRFTLSPEDGLDNLRSLLAEFGSRAVLIVHQDTPLFLAESCAYANLIGGCPGKANCKFESMEMASTHGEKVTALDYHCRTIVLNQGAFCLSTRLPELAQAGAISLRADFIYRKYKAEEVQSRWRLLRAGQPVPGGHAANFDRGIL